MLSDLKARKAKCPDGKKQVKLYDGHGLYLLVTAQGRKYWRMDYRFEGKRKTLALGVYPEVSLEEARELALQARKALRQGMDPVLLKRMLQAEGVTFRQVYEEWSARHLPTLAEKTRQKIASFMHRYVLPAIGNAPIQRVDAPMVLALLRRIEAQGKVHTAHRVRQVIGQVFRYAVATGRASTDPTYALRGALAPERPSSRAAILDPARLAELMRAIHDYGGFPGVRNALLALAHTFVRPGELRLAQWCEIDLDSALWRIPAHRTKMRREHLVPLSRQVLAILQEQRERYPWSELVFPGARMRRPLSDNTFNMALRAMGYDGRTHVAHGFRATARSLLAEHGWPPEAIERQLAHVEQSKSVRAYARAEHLETRRAMMQAWSDYLDRLREGRPKEASAKLRYVQHLGGF
ncbi:MAG: DUF4102 domain-containing protein [Deltaproteobacteria bacterium]|nr:MAG: DUF4102 domain-containing protein [Deltaproteobacteria bacterium]